MLKWLFLDVAVGPFILLYVAIILGIAILVGGLIFVVIRIIKKIKAEEHVDAE